MQFSILYVFTLAAAAMAATGDVTDFQKRQIRNDVDKPVMTDAQGNVKAFDAADVYLPSKGQRKNKRFYKA